jgi:hypothetical protein
MAFVSNSVGSMVMWLQSHESVLGWAALFSLIMMTATLFAVPLIIVRLPSGYLNEEKDLLSKVPPIWRRPYLIVKNIIGATLVLAGLAMLILPGQGLLTLIIGLGLMNFPGKRRLIRRVILRRRVLAAINRMRAGADKEPIEMPDEISGK